MTPDELMRQAQLQDDVNRLTRELAELKSLGWTDLAAENGRLRAELAKLKHPTERAESHGGER